LRDFPDSELIALQAAYADVAPRRGFNALRRAFIPALLPEDFSFRARLISALDGPALPALGPTHDLFGDGSVLLFALPGHARGQVGMLAHTERGRILFAADGCWMSRSIRERRPPNRVTHLFMDDAWAMRNTIDHLHAFSQMCPDVMIIPSHCPEVFAREVGQQR
jgi:glyoxylase-like metal-dependent hydrolase (beta-lactamase superfamily II)